MIVSDKSDRKVWKLDPTLNGKSQANEILVTGWNDSRKHESSDLWEEGVFVDT